MDSEIEIQILIFQGIFPVNGLFSRSLKFPTTNEEVLKEYSKFPHLTSHKSSSLSIEGSRRVNLEFSLGYAF